ncbi:MAG TPA: hypothetical protein VGP93_09850 [Polyangiaceae bacterium]|nr:hypothetical protein [Polyangiaceae bacterium]
MTPPCEVVIGADDAASVAINSSTFPTLVNTSGGGSGAGVQSVLTVMVERRAFRTFHSRMLGGPDDTASALALEVGTPYRLVAESCDNS